MGQFFFIKVLFKLKVSIFLWFRIGGHLVRHAWWIILPYSILFCKRANHHSGSLGYCSLLILHCPASLKVCINHYSKRGAKPMELTILLGDYVDWLSDLLFVRNNTIYFPEGINKNIKTTEKFFIISFYICLVAPLNFS